MVSCVSVKSVFLWNKNKYGIIPYNKTIRPSLKFYTVFSQNVRENFCSRFDKSFLRCSFIYFFYSLKSIQQKKRYISRGNFSDSE